MVSIASSKQRTHDGCSSQPQDVTEVSQEQYNGGIDQTVYDKLSHPGHWTVRAFAQELLELASTGSHQAELIDSGAMPLLVTMLRMPHAAAVAAAALCKIVKNSESSHALFIQNYGLAALVEVLNTVTTSGVQAQMVALIWQLVQGPPETQDSLRGRGVVKVLVKILRDALSNPKRHDKDWNYTVERAAGALSMIAASDKVQSAKQTIAAKCDDAV